MQRNYLKIGGTPSLLEKKDFELIFKTISLNFSVAKNAEITIEANPDDLTKEKLRIFKTFGINRLSIGIQTFDDENLKFLNRVHSSIEAENSVKMAQDLGIHNISCDLIYAIPAENHSVFEKDLEKIISLTIPHISAYCLTIEPKTVFGNWLKTSKLAAIDDDFAAKEFEILTKTLAENDFEQYEISNFCKSEMYSKHNTSYWQRQEYLGVGPSAHSYNYKCRQYNIANNAKYIQSIQEKKIPFEIEILTPFEEVNDYIMTTLRTKWGFDLSEIKKIVGESWQQENSKILEKYLNTKLLSLDNQRVMITQSGKLFADKIASDLFLV
jgi:oxygen-independent coproporphyrinogen III oxidase